MTVTNYKRKYYETLLEANSAFSMAVTDATARMEVIDATIAALSAEREHQDTASREATVRMHVINNQINELVDWGPDE